MTTATAAGSPSSSRVVLLGAIALLLLVPVTLPVPVLRGLVQERFLVSDLLTACFMSINMVGAVLAAPIAGMLADRGGRRARWIAAALVIDAACFAAMTADLTFAAFLAIRFVEGCAHIVALSLLLSLAAASSGPERRGRVMGAVGAGLTLGVALGAPLGGALGRDDALQPLRAGAIVCLATAALVLVVLPDVRSTSRRPSLRAIVATLRRERGLWAPLSFAFADRFTVGFFTTVFPLYVQRVHALPVERVGLLLGLFLGPFALLSYPAGRLAERRVPAHLVIAGSAIYGALVVTLGWWPSSALPYLMVGLGVTSAVMFVPCLISTSEAVSGDVRSTALGAFNAAGSLGFIVGPLVGGMVAQEVGAVHGLHQGYRMSFVVAGLAELLCVLLAGRALLRAARLRGRAAPGR